MKDFRYIDGVSSLRLDVDKCTGCGMCAVVCPHRIPEIIDGKARLNAPDACIECGACATNCAFNAISVNPGVGCAAFIVEKWLASAGIKTKGTGCC